MNQETTEPNDGIKIVREAIFQQGKEPFTLLSPERIKELHQSEKCYLWEASMIVLGFEPEPVRHEGLVQRNAHKLPDGWKEIFYPLVKACSDKKITYEETVLPENKPYRDAYKTIKIASLKGWWGTTELPKNSFYHYHEYEDKDLNLVFDKKNPCHSPKLALALKAWQKVSEKFHEKGTTGVKKLLKKEINSLQETCLEGKKLLDADLTKIIEIANWNYDGGPPNIVKENRPQNTTSPFCKRGIFYSYRLDAALSAWFAISENNNFLGESVKQKLNNWMEENRDKFISPRGNMLSVRMMRSICSIMDWESD